jgi:hypothetical protein
MFWHSHIYAPPYRGLWVKIEIFILLEQSYFAQALGKFSPYAFTFAITLTTAYLL